MTTRRSDEQGASGVLREQREANELLVLANLRAQAATETAQKLVRELEERAELREELMAIVGHDLKNPLAAILVAAEQLLRRGDLTGRDVEVARRIVRSADRMSRIILQILEFSRVRLGGGLPIELEPCDLGDILQRVGDELGGDAPARIEQVREGDLRGTWDADRLEQLLSNLVSNAVDHAAAGTPVVIRARGTDAHVTVEVENEGEAIPPDLLPVLFDAFKPQLRDGSRAGHLGLGLYIAHQIATGHGGSLSARSGGGKTTFTLRVPREPRRPA